MTAGFMAGCEEKPAVIDRRYSGKASVHGPTLKRMRHMKRNAIALITFISLAGVLTASLAGVFTASPGTPALQTSATQAQLATINQYCVGCHNDRAKTGGVSFEGLKPESIGEEAEVFEKAVRKLRGRVMPPPGSEQPDATAIDSLVARLADPLHDPAGNAHGPDPHRL